ncbi:divergent polysaccharide deacetylase family protein [Catenovulum sp. 2E275]|uniref:divergent polysaccharide deacetylase family protein n=1 Tax=Catenovulum sp. 2E275 TaxID=2980497 RepID=UPI0021D2C864|nr:divergent polysaccharide deacetylase family protein [Catenovulum sp. 2E275]MCU4675074.1 divergent polysaccharide deacetylase family protein [Catenovulum sp. 2E275]
MNLLITRINRANQQLVAVLLSLFLGLNLFFYSVLAHAEIAIIIDDVGYNQRDFELLTLPAEVTLSVLPHTPFSKKIAEQAYRRGQEIMLHLPMESISGRVLEPGTIEANMDKAEILNTLDSALAEFPYATGVNNHMGSRLTQLYEPMNVIMQALKMRNLYFVDSRTTSHSIALEVAQKQGVTAYRRHVFLDNVLDEQAIRKQLDLVLKLAEKKQTVIAIGHPHPQTIAALHAFFAENSAKNIELTKVSSLEPASSRYAKLNSNDYKAD